MEKLTLFIVKNKEGQFAKWTHPFSVFDCWVDEYDEKTCVTHNSAEVLSMAEQKLDLEIHIVEPETTDVYL